MLCCIQCTHLSKWLHSYDSLQTCGIVLLCLQVVCSLIGSVGAFYTGLLVANLAVALFGLVAIESGSQNLGRAYAALLACSLLVDITWFIFFSLETRHGSPWNISLISVNIVFWMQVTSCVLRLLSSFLWVQMYRLGARAVSATYYPVEYEAETRVIMSLSDESRSRIPPLFGSPLDTPTPSHAVSISEEILGGSIYDPSTFPSLFRSSDEPYFTSGDIKQDSTTYNGPNLTEGSQPVDPLLDKHLQPAAAS